ncbi:MAG: FHA domain-containing protein [Clostridium sp.]|nr:FHA domain-containing protein [Clostridium sp.]
MYIVALDLSGLNQLSSVFRYVIIGIVYLIIIVAIIIMYKDMKNSDRRPMRNRHNNNNNNNVSNNNNKENSNINVNREKESKFGLEVVNSGISKSLRQGSVIPIDREITIGRREENSVVIQEAYVSGHHAKVYSQNGRYVLQDLQSTNGTLLNGEKIQSRVYINIGDEVQIGTTIFKVIG